MRRLGWLQPHSARRGREGAGAMSDRELRASGRRGVGSGERGVGSGSAERGERGVGSGSAERGGRGEGGGSAERGEREGRGSPMPWSGACRWRALPCGG